MTVKFGVMVPQEWRLDLTHIKDPIEQYELMTQYGREAERLGYDSIWLYDNFHTWPTTRLEATFECWTSTAALARDTSTIRIGQMVTCNSYRNPALLAKMASTVDVLSHGRLAPGGVYSLRLPFPCWSRAAQAARRGFTGHSGYVESDTTGAKAP